MFYMFCAYIIIIIAVVYIVNKLYWANLRNLVERTSHC